MMPRWKRDVFICGVSTRMEREGLTLDYALSLYNRLTKEEKAEIREGVIEEQRWYNYPKSALDPDPNVNV